jgi:hypothetical protein
MPFSLRLGKSPLDRRPRSGGASEAGPGPSNIPAFARGLLIGFCAAFVVFDWALTGGATTRSFLNALQRLLTAR